MVEPACKVYIVLHDVNEDEDLVTGPAQDESAADYQWRHDGVAASRVQHPTTRQSRNLPDHQSTSTLLTKSQALYEVACKGARFYASIC